MIRNTLNYYNSFTWKCINLKRLVVDVKVHQGQVVFQKAPSNSSLLPMYFFLYFDIDVGCSTLTNNGLPMTSLCTKGVKNILLEVFWIYVARWDLFLIHHEIRRTLMTSQLPNFWCFFAVGSWEKDTENRAAVT